MSGGPNLTERMLRKLRIPRERWEAAQRRWGMCPRCTASRLVWLGQVAQWWAAELEKSPPDR